jgi:hypothetical protein
VKGFSPARSRRGRPEGLHYVRQRRVAPSEVEGRQAQDERVD